MNTLKKITSFLVLMILFSACSFSNLSTPTVDANLPKIEYDSIKTISDITSIAFEWKRINNPDIVGYNFYRSDLKKDGKNLKLIKSLTNRFTTHYLDINLEPNTKYAYQISAVSKSGVESKTTNAYIVKTLPRITPVSFIQAISNLPNRIKISWRPKDDKRVEYYVVEKFNKKDNSWKFLKKINGRLQSEYIDINLKSDETCKYRIISYTFDDIASTPSKVVSATTKPLPIGVQNLKASTNIAKKIELTWEPSPNSDIVKYVVYRSPFEILGYTNKAELKANVLRFTDNVNSDGKDYYYRVFAVDKDNLKSKKLEPVRGTSLKKPARPIITLAQIQGNKAILNWIAGDNRATSYIVYKRIKENLFNSKTFRYNNVNSLRFEDTEITPGVEYLYSVQALDENNIYSRKTDETKLILPKTK